MTELDVEKLKRHVDTTGWQRMTRPWITWEEWDAILAALEDRDRLRAVAQKSLDEAVERAELATTSVNPKGALEVAVVGLWNIRDQLRAALEGREPT